MKKLLSYLFIITPMFILYSCNGGITESGGPISIRTSSDGSECQLYCIGERIFPSEILPDWVGLNKKNRNRKNDKGEVKGDSIWGYNPCVVARYSWDSFNQKEIDYGEKICSAKANTKIRKYNQYECSIFDSNLDEKLQIKKSLEKCENEWSWNKTTTTTTTTSETKDQNEEEIENAKQKCRLLGFTEAQDIAECGLKFLTTEKELNNSGATTTNNNVLERQIQLNNAIRLMQMGKNLLDIPKQKSVNCRYTLTGWTCN